MKLQQIHLPPPWAVWITIYWVSYHFNGLIRAHQFAALYISHSCSASSRLTHHKGKLTNTDHYQMSLLSLCSSFLSFPSVLSLLFFSPKQWSHWKTWVQAKPLHPSQPSRIRAHIHEQTHGSVRCIRPRHHLANELWKLVPVNALIHYDPPTLTARWPCVSSYFRTHTRKGEAAGVGSPPPRLTWSSRQVWEPKWSRCSQAPLPPPVFHRKEQRIGNDSKL